MNRGFLTPPRAVFQACARHARPAPHAGPVPWQAPRAPAAGASGCAATGHRKRQIIVSLRALLRGPCRSCCASSARVQRPAANAASSEARGCVCALLLGCTSSPVQALRRLQGGGVLQRRVLKGALESRPQARMQPRCAARAAEPEVTDDDDFSWGGL